MLPETLYPWLNLVSGLLVVVIGVTVLRSHLRRRHHHHHHHGHATTTTATTTITITTTGTATSRRNRAFAGCSRWARPPG